MKLGSILKKVGKGILKEAIPGGGLLLEVLNSTLPDGKKIPDGVKGTELSGFLESLPPEHRAAILEKEFDVSEAEIREPQETLRTMLNTEINNSHTTRPKIALGAFRIIAFSTITVISIWATAVLLKDAELVDAVTGGWQFILSVLGPLITLLWAYFGILKTEQKNKLNAANRFEASGVTGALMNLFKKK